MTKRTLITATLALTLVVGAHTARAGKPGGTAAKGTVVALVTNHGTIEIKLFTRRSPKTTANFLSYVNSKFYDGTIFHRVMSNFMIQGGGLTKSYKKKTTRAAIINEATNRLSNKRGTVAMARTNDPHTATAQFFINVQDNDNLDHPTTWGNNWGYCVFGEVVKGMNVVDKIRNVRVRRRGVHTHAPVNHVVIKRAYVVK